ncbi:Ubiquinone/menaquinone biosynthesis C-methylase UbiE [Lentzea albidocapillata subsp. violacea]|uniref:Ubiquinone/menaquinone biosynthesis C-methylase UbiE n=1 Tax=Lentzea albidocapillata subsp. violacea TaxID=128104 RepID=A0A1G9WW81_9PSEU|nr:methyltransferase domain-containing protein [Lentzea albidocapillata]SDM88335.1 Ubiquinone/menaquinone biosynthesis C-methylase UbiE [Lentzea albidocapillata subsp. violacea]
MSNETTNQADADGRVALLDRADSLPGAAALRTRSYELLGCGRGAVVVDVGCGTGRAVAEMTERGATAVGVDIGEHLITVGRSRWPQARFQVASADELPFADGEVDAYRADKVFHELDDPAEALREARRVLGPEGRVVLLGQDWDTFVIDSDDAELTRIIVRARADTVPSPRAARSYRNLLLDAGFVDVTVEVYTGIFTDTAMLPVLLGIAEVARAAGTITQEQADRWAAEQTERARAGRMFFALPLFVASARR